MIKTNVHPYVYMTKYALKHFSENAASHQHQNALLYTSSTAAMIDFPMFGTYAGTKTHNFALANMVRMALSKSDTMKDLVRVQSLHPATVTSNLNNFRGGDKAPDAVSPDECAKGSLSDLNSLTVTFGAFKHSILGLITLPLVRAFGPLPMVQKFFLKEFENDRDVILEPFYDKKN